MNIQVTNLGDVNPLDYGGFFLVERSGEGSEDYQSVECVVIELDNPDEQEEEKQQFTVYRFVPELCYFERDPNSGYQGVLSDNEYHKDMPAWFASDILRYRDDFDEFIDDITSENPDQRAIAYRDIGDYHGFDNLDNYPLQFTSRDEIVEWMKNPSYQLEEYV